MSMAGAQIPTWSKVGSRPIRKVVPPMMNRLRISSSLRPIRSPKWPKTIPPSGRAANPTA